MAKSITKGAGTPKEQETFNVVNQHYEMATEDNESRWSDWDTRYELFRSYLDEDAWPYSAMIFIPETFTALFEKSARLNGGKPRGRLVPRDEGDMLGAKINNELLNFQWDEATREDNQPMTAKWALMDLQTRIYGASFGVANWRYRTNRKGDIKFDGPMFKVIPPKDSLPNPSYSYIKDWFQYREYVTLKELKTVNDRSLTKPKYKNLDLLEQSLRENTPSGGDTRESTYASRGKEIQGLTDYTGMDEDPDFRTVELITELRDDRKIVFAVKHGIILSDEENPYDHEQMPITMLRYISVDDDIWGMSEIEPVEKLQKALNALSSQAIDTINMDLYRVLKVRGTGVQMHTLEFAPGKKWIMNNPDDVTPLETSTTAINKFVDIYSVLTAMFRQAMGESSGQFSGFGPTESDKTATEIQEGQLTRSVRDNFNKIFLSEAIKKQMMLWHLMNKQFMFENLEDHEFHILRIVGRDTLQEFKEMGLDAWEEGGSEEEILAAAQEVEMGEEPTFRERPNYPVEVKGEVKPKLDIEKGSEYGTLYMTPEDMTGNYDYIADVEPMHMANSFEERRLAKEIMNLLMTQPAQLLLQEEGKSIKFSELLLDTFDKFGYKGAEKYFGEAKQEATINEQTTGIEQAGEGIAGGGGGIGQPQTPQGLVDNPGLAGEQGVSQLGRPQRL